jgi:DNA gyrase subunit B
MALQDAALLPRADATPISGDALEELARAWLLAEAVIERLAHHIDPEVLHAVVAHNLALDLDDQAAAEASAARLAPHLPAGTQVGADYDAEQESWQLRMTRMHHGNLKVGLIDADFLRSGDYAQLRRTAELLDGLFGPGAVVRRGERQSAVGDFAQTMRWLMNEVEKGISKQRYKGLGEMNPEQLWETTMDPAVRRLLKVTIEDAIGADEVFTTLMGELVEPRRNFIESNALYARNLDV